jgi:hypothetical protein
MPLLQQLRLVIAYQFLDSHNFPPRKSPSSLQANGFKPELSDFVFTLYMNMWRFIAISCVKEQAVGTYP